MTFDHWYQLDSTAAGGVDGVWVEYRTLNNGWSNWSYIAPDGGYPSTMSTSAPSPEGAPAGAVPVFASPTYSGWTTSNISMSSISDISSASKIQFRFHIWTDPSSSNERPGWFLDTIHYNNGGIQSYCVVSLVHNVLPSRIFYVAFEFGAERSVIPTAAKSSIYFTPREYEPSSLAQRY